jgi:parallel beta-helix repeat protein
VLYGPGSTLEVVRSRLAYLGTDRWQGADGVTWDGATGKALGSVFHHNLSGASASAGRRVRFVANVVRDNAAHGLDAHGASSSLLVQGNRAFRNGRSGIALAAAADAIVRANNAIANGADGIVAADGSDHGVLTGNVVERNRGDGIVVLGSSDVLVHGNLVRGNHVGVRVSQHSADDRVEANQVIGNERGIELAGGARDVALAGNLVAGSAVLGIELRAPASVSHGDHVEGGQVGVEVDSLARLDGTTVRAVRRGILVTARGIAELRQVRVTAAKAGVEVASGGLVRVERSRLAAPEPFAGAAPRAEHGNALVSRNALLPSVAVASALMLVVALMLRLLQRARYRPAPERKEPQGAWYAS